MTVELGWTGWMRELRGRGGQWTDGGGVGAASPNLGGAQWTDGGGPSDPRSLDNMARAAANAHPDVQRLVNQSRAAAAAGDMQRSRQLWQQASDLAAQKINEYKDNAALDSFKPTAWEKAHPEEVAHRRMVQQQLTDSSGGGGGYGGGPNGGMDELSNMSRGIDLAAGSYRPPRMPAYKPTSGMRKATAASMRKLAGGLKERHPDMGSHQHITDAAAALDRNQPQAAIRHLTAAIGNMTPQSLRRHGLLTDDQHDAAKHSMDAIHRHLLLVKDIQDQQEQNSQLPHSELPGEGGGVPGSDDLTDKPTARQPGGDKAMNAPDKTNIGRIDINVSKPQQVTNPKSASQIAASNSGDLTTAIELGWTGWMHEERGKGGQWTHGDVAALADKIDKTGTDYARLNASWDTPHIMDAGSKMMMNGISAKVRAGKYHEAADALDNTAESIDKTLAGGERPLSQKLSDHRSREMASRLREHAATLRQVNLPDPAFTAKLEAQNKRLAAAASANERAFRARIRKEDHSTRNIGIAAAQAQVQMDYVNQPETVFELGHFDPLKHPRDEHGRFAHGSGGTARLYTAGKGETLTEAAIRNRLSKMAKRQDNPLSSRPPMSQAERRMQLGKKFPATGTLTKGQVVSGALKKQVDEAASGWRKSIGDYDRAVDAHQIKFGKGEFADKYPGQAGSERAISGFVRSKLSPMQLATELSAQTGALASTPHPFGKPGGPGLWHQKGMELPPYIQNIARAILREGRAKSLGEAIAIAKSSTSKWAVKSKHPEVRAASAATNADWDAKRAIAHSHANVSALARAIELTGTAAGASQDQHSAATGQFTSGSSSSSGPRATGSAAAKSGQQGKSGSRASLSAQLTTATKRLGALKAQQKTLQGELASASGKTSSGQSGSTTSSGASTTQSSATTPSSSTAAASSSSASSSSTPSSASSTSAASASAQQVSQWTQQLASVTKAIGQVTAQITQLKKQLGQ